jgi:electron transport complex protein RnfA
MPNKFALFLTLTIFAGMSMNLILRFGIGLQRIASDEDSSCSGKKAKWVFLVWLGIYFISIILLWLFFSALRSVLFLGFLEYIMVFPVSALYFTAIKYLSKRLINYQDWEAVLPDFFLANNGAPIGGAPIGAALFITLGLAGGFAEAITLSFGFSTGAALAVLVIGEIKRRSGMEAVPRFLRGGPLVLVTMGLLSLVITSAAIIFYNVLGAK